MQTYIVYALGRDTQANIRQKFRIHLTNETFREWKIRNLHWFISRKKWTAYNIVCLVPCVTLLYISMNNDTTLSSCVTLIIGEHIVVTQLFSQAGFEQVSCKQDVDWTYGIAYGSLPCSTYCPALIILECRTWAWMYEPELPGVRSRTHSNLSIEWSFRPSIYLSIQM